MGVPRLRHHVQAFATDAVLDNESVVIDGPALAYHIHSLCTLNGGGIPSCKVLGKAFLCWLEELVSHDISVEAIYFDGYLPPEKLQVRLTRVARSTTQGRLLCRDNRQGCPLGAFKAASTPSVFFPPTLATPDGTFPSNPFLVVAALDALRTSRFASVTYVVPGEADPFCALHASQRAVNILTSDSDLLVHDIGSSSVVFIDDVYSSAAPNRVLRCAKFSPSVIARRLDLPSDSNKSGTSLSRLGFELQRTPSATLPMIVQSCQTTCSLRPRQYLEFMIPYRGRLGDCQGPDPQSSLSRSTALDPRISELIVQARGGDSMPSHSRLQSDTPLTFSAVEPRMFLPLLLESHSHDSAFEPSTQVRQIAYSLICTHRHPAASIPWVWEYRRVQLSQGRGTRIDILSEPHLQDAVVRLAHDMARLSSWVSATDGQFLWLSVALWMEMAYSASHGRKSLGALLLRRPLPSTLDKLAHVPWDLLHFKAQAEACCYSFRILGQIQDWLEQHGAHRDLLVGASMSSLLRPSLSKVPPTDGFPDTTKTLQFFRSVRGSPFIALMFQEFGILDTDTLQSSKKGERERSSKYADPKLPSSSAGTGSADTTASSNNPFGLLGVER